MIARPADSPLFERAVSGPDFTEETTLHRQGSTLVCGLDEAGRGPLAGPVVAAAVVLDPSSIPDGLDDSKKLSGRRREALFVEIMTHADVSIASVCAAAIDRINIRNASLLAMEQAANGLCRVPQHALVDGNALPQTLPCPATALVKGDARSLSVAAASIIAKVVRDRMMALAETHYPDYGFAGHKGYPTKTHVAALRQYGPCPLHRSSFAPVREVLYMQDQAKQDAGRKPI